LTKILFTTTGRWKLKIEKKKQELKKKTWAVMTIV
jgi:hypothetical protein